MRVLVADSDPGVRWGLRLLLTHDLGMQVVDEVTDRADLWPQVQRTTPDLLVLEWGMLGAEPAAVLARLRAAASGLGIVTLSGHPELRQIALAAGADACISKTDSPAQVRETLRAVAKGDSGGG
jgi:DNA-binding NarL/FixJ family response regulator